MSGFEALPNAITDEGTPLTATEVAFDNEQLSDEAALTIVKDDAASAQSYLQSKSLVTDWATHDDLYRGYVKPRVWPGTDVPRANLSMPLILEVIEKLMPELYLSFFSDDMPFEIQPKGKTSPAAARARGKVLAWSLKQADFKEQMRLCMKSCLQYGFTVGKYGWETKKETVKTYRRKAQPQTVLSGPSQIAVNTVESDEVECVETEIDINKPVFENIELRNVLIDPKLRSQDCRKGRFVIFQLFTEANGLLELKGVEGYKNIPTRDELAVILSTKSEPTIDSLSGTKDATFRDLQAEPEASGPATGDPLQQPLEILEYWTDDRVITVLQRKLVIRNEQHEFKTKPFVSSAWIDVLGSAYGFGVAKLLAGEQRFETGVINSWIDQLALILNPVFQAQKGVGAGTQNIKFSPGKVVTEASELKQLSTNANSAEALNAIATSEARANRRVGSNGGSDMPTQALRTAQGVAAFQSDVTNRLQYWMDIFSNLVFIPVLEAFVEMCNDHLKPSQIDAILSDTDGKAYEGDVMEVYNATTSINVLATTKLAARKAAMQLVPTIVQLVSSAPVQDSLTQQNRKFNYEELLEEMLDLGGWNADALIVEMTPDDQQRAAAMNPAAQKAAGDAQKQQLTNEGTLQAIEAKGTANAGVAIVKHLLEESKDGTALQNILSQQQVSQGPTGA